MTAKHLPSRLDEDALFERGEGGLAAEGGRLSSSNMLLRDLLSRWYWIVLGGVLGLLGASYYLTKAPEQFTATTTLLIKQRTASVMNQDQMEEISLSSQEGLNTVAERVRRMDLLERVASRQDIRDLSGLVPQPVNWFPGWVTNLRSEKVELLPSVPSPQVLAGMLAQKMQVTLRRNTRLLDITFTHEVPEVAKTVADGVAREYLAEITGDRNIDRSSSMELLVKESNAARSKLQQASVARSLYARSLELHRALEAQEAKIQAMRGRYREKHPDMIAAIKELSDLQSRFMVEFDDVRKAPVESDYWETTAEFSSKSQPPADPSERLRTARQLLLARDQVLDSEISSQNAVFQAMLTQIQNATINQKGNESEAEVSSFARVPGRPTSPVMAKVLAIGSVAGLASGLALAFLLARLDNKFHTVSQLEEYTGLSVLAAIARLSPRRLAKALEKYQQGPGRLPGALAVRPDMDQTLLFQPGLSETTYAEMFRVLRVSLSLLGEESQRKLTLFTSALPGEGKSTVSANCALAAAAQGRRVLLIDFDLRKPTLHQLFGIQSAEASRPQAGLVECLAGHASFVDAVIQQSGHENLHLLLGGRRAPNPGELIHPARVAELLKEACRYYHHIVIDSAPLLAVSDTRLLAPLVHNVCLVVRAEYTPKTAVLRAIDLLIDAGAPPAGLIFNGYGEKRRDMGYNYSYGYYRSGKYGAETYGYGYGEEEEGQGRVRRKRSTSTSRR